MLHRLLYVIGGAVEGGMCLGLGTGALWQMGVPPLDRHGEPWTIAAFVVGAVAGATVEMVFERHWSFVLMVRRAARRRRGLCPQCGYDLRGSPDGTCPECGRHADQAEA